ncbi:hypothetical protein [Brevundimonas nasdae]|uniref:hypothetical protein n=1 Tax=Brevundimonas nasdae TaxID=172043 RepID=UPI003F68D4DB
MTDATAGRGGVGIRLFVEGGEVVKRTFSQIGDSGKKMWAEIATGARTANPGMNALSAGAQAAKGQVEDLAGEAGSAGNVLSKFGATGLAVAAALGAVAIGLQRAREGMKFAADLTDAADAIGVGAEALQEMRYVADEAGVSVDKVQANMEKLNGVVGAFKLGIGDGKLKPIFEELGITKDQLSKVDDAHGLMLLLSDSLGQIKDRAAQVRLARGLGVEESLPILRLGSEGIKRLSGDARELGLVMSDEVRARFDEADRSMERSQQRIDMALRGAVVGLAEEFAGLVEVIADVVQWLDRLETYTITDNPVANAGTWVNHKVRDLMAGRNGSEADAFWSPLGADIADRVAAFQTRPGESWRSGGGFDLKGHTTKSSDAAARKAEREAEQRRQREQRYLSEIDRADRDLDSAWSRGGHMQTIEARAGNELTALERERVARLREIARSEEEYIRSKGLRGLTKAEADTLRAKEEELTSVKQSLVRDRERRELAERRLQQDEEAAAAANELLDIDAQMTRTSRERYRIEREILLATIETARTRKKFELDRDPELDDEQRAALMGRFDRNANRQVQLFDYRESERLREQFKSYGRDVVDAIRAGRIGEYIGDQLKQRLLDGALDQLFNLFTMAGRAGANGRSSSGGGLMSSAFNAVSSFFGSGPGRAAGGDVRAGLAYPVVEHGRPELLMIGGQGQVTSAAETARLFQELGDARGWGAGAGSAAMGEVLEVRVDKSEFFDVEVRRVAKPLADQARRGGAADAINASRRGAAAVQRGQMRLGTS